MRKDTGLLFKQIPEKFKLENIERNLICEDLKFLNIGILVRKAHIASKVILFPLLFKTNTMTIKSKIKIDISRTNKSEKGS